LLVSGCALGVGVVGCALAFLYRTPELIFGQLGALLSKRLVRIRSKGGESVSKGGVVRELCVCTCVGLCERVRVRVRTCAYVCGRVFVCDCTSAPSASTSFILIGTSDACNFKCSFFCVEGQEEQEEQEGQDGGGSMK
jgi:hypothetical protein